MADKGNLKLWVVAGDASFAGPKPAPRPGESVGLFLRLLRERAGLTIDEAARNVRIRAAYVSAIEDDRFEVLPGRAYAQGFIRAYAEYLGADVDQTARAALGDIGRLPEPALKARKPEVERESRFAPVAAACICVALAGYVYWYFENTSARFGDAAETLARVDAPSFVETAEPAPVAVASGPYRPFPEAEPPTTRTVTAAAPPPQQSAPQTGAPLPPSRYQQDRPRYAAAPAQAPTAAPTAPANLPPRDALAANLPEPRLAAPPTEPRWSIPAPGPAMASSELASLPPSYAAAATPPQPQVPPPAPAAGLVELHAAADTWIEIRSIKTGKVIFSRVLREGETYDVPDRRGLKMTVGNAGGLEIRVDGQLAPSLGGHGKVVRDVHLEASQLFAGR